jgi:hypothetical protein
MERTVMNETMKHFACNSMRLLAGACGLFALLAVTPAVVAQQTAAAHAGRNPVATQANPASAATGAAARPVAEEETAAPNSPRSQGIKVHGHWVLQVKNTDGTLGERREFDNSLVAGEMTLGGDQLLAGLLSGNLSAGDPAIAFVPAVPSGTAVNYCNSYLGITNSSCYLFDTSQNAFFGSKYTNSETGLTTQLTPYPPQWVLSGNYTVPSGLTTIAVVQTLLQACLSLSGNSGTSRSPFLGSSGTRTADVSAAACTINASGAIGTSGDSPLIATLTSTAVPGGPISVSTGQVVAITVIITFS